MESINKLVTIAKEANSPDKTESAYMDLIESLIRHIAIISISAYKNHGSKDKKINREIIRQLPLPAFGSWKNIVTMLSNANKEFFPDLFFDNFLAGLNNKINNSDISSAYGRINELIELATSEKKDADFKNSEKKCTPLQFFEIMVSYRNRFIGHGTSNMPDYVKDSVSIIKEGVVKFASYLNKLWVNYPIYKSEQRSLAGESFTRLTSLSKQNAHSLEFSNPDLKADQLFICLNKKKERVETLFPLAILHDNDVMFFNGTKDFKNLLYLGYNARESAFGTPKFETQFCSYYLSFFNLNLDKVNLENNNSWGRIIDFIKNGWKFPKLKKGIMIGHKGSDDYYELIKKEQSDKVFEIWKAKNWKNDTIVDIKFLQDVNYSQRFRRDALVLKNMSEISKDIKYFEFSFQTHPHCQVLYTVVEHLSEKTLKIAFNEDISLDENDITLLLKKSLRAIIPFHGNKMILRNITPDNLVLDGENNIKIRDLSLTGYLQDNHSNLVNKINNCNPSDAIDLFQVASPEQLKHGQVGKEVTCRSDIFSLAASFYYLITKTYPFGSESETIVASNHATAANRQCTISNFKPITDINPNFKHINRLLTGMLNIDPELRPDAVNILEEIEDYENDIESESSNTNFKLLSDVENSDIRFKGIMPTWLHHYIFKIWPLLILLVLVSSIIISVKLSIFEDFDKNVIPTSLLDSINSVNSISFSDSISFSELNTLAYSKTLSDSMSIFALLTSLEIKSPLLLLASSDSILFPDSISFADIKSLSDSILSGYSKSLSDSISTLDLVLSLDSKFRLDIKSSLDLISSSSISTQPLTKDYAFFIWIFLPLVLIIILYRIVKSIQPLMKDVFILDKSNYTNHWIKSKERNDLWSAIMHSHWLKLIPLFLTGKMFKDTWDKVANCVDFNNTVIVWSHWDISLLAFLLKELLVIVNGIGVVYSILFLIATIHMLSFILRGTNMRLDFYDKNNQHGLKSVEKLILLFLPFFMLFLYALVFLYVIEVNANMSLTILLGVIILTFIYFFFIFWPIIPIHIHIRKKINDEIRLLKNRRIMLEDKRKKYLTIQSNYSDSQAKEILSLGDLHEDILKQENNIRMLNRWPLNKKSLFLIILLGIIPTITIIVFEVTPR